MKLQFLGGADEIGASCTLLEISGHRILVDCGVRMKDRSGSSLPDLSQIQNGGIEAVVLTHSHIDHSGGLPVVYQLYDIPLYLTAPTLSLISIMLVDAQKIMEMEMEEGEIPLYSLHEVEKVITASRPLPFEQTVEICGGDVRLTFYACGHILGAACAVLEGKNDGRILISGDISVGRQLTIPGMKPPKLKLDAVVLESTYGGRLHADRKQQEQRLIEQAAKVVSNRGAMLIPAFAVGRAQEVILILAKAIEKGNLPKAPIIVDGLVRNICRVYSSYPYIVTPFLRKRIAKHGNPFFGDGKTVFPVWDPRKRIEYTKIRPAIIVSSSGMLAGGPSQLYARELAGGPKNFIAITGYQDEESPGRRIQELAEVGHGEIQLGESVIGLQCGIGTYSLSAHADTSELVGILKALSPEQVLLVHGDHQAREELAKATQRSGITNIQCPTLGEEVVIEKFTKRRQKAVTLQPTGESITAQNIKAVAKKLLDQDGFTKPFTIQEIMIAGGYPPAMINDEELERVSKILAAPMSPFKQDSKKPFIYRIRVTQRGRIICGSKNDKEQQGSGKWEQNKVANYIDKIIPPEAGLHKKSFRPHREVQLAFYFPKTAKQRYAELFAKIQEETGWQVTVADKLHQEELKRRALAIIPEDWPIAKSVSLYLEEEKIAIQVQLAQPPLAQITEQLAAFTKETGFKLVVVGCQPDSLAAPVKIAKATVATPATTATTSELQKSETPLEINQAYGLIRKKFQEQPHQPLKMSLRETYIELAFISPQVADRYEKIIAEAAKATGWPIKIKSQPDQYRIIQIIKTLVPESWNLAQQPSLYIDLGQAMILVNADVPEDQVDSIVQKCYQETGYHLEVINSDLEEISTILLDAIIIPNRLSRARLNPLSYEKLKSKYRHLGKTPVPVKVKAFTPGRYLLIDGLKRVLAARELGYATIEAYIDDPE